MPCADLVDGDCLLGAVDFLDFCELAAYLASSKRLSLHACAAWDARSWRMQSLEARIPGHVKWRPAGPPDPQLKGSLLACATWRLARGVQLYEQKRFKNAEDELRALLTILPGRPFAMCRLADTLYGRAVSLHSGASQPSSRSSTPASAGEAWVEPTHRDEIDDRDQGDPDRDEAEEELPVMPYSHSPLSPAPGFGQDQADQATEVDPVQSAPSVMSELSDPIVAPEPLISRAAVVRWQQTAEDLPGAVATERDLTSSTASASTPRTPQGQQPQTPPPWTTSWTPPLEVDEGLEAEAEMQEREEPAGDEDTLRARASSWEEDEPPARLVDLEEARESTSKIEALRERLLSEAKDLYEQAFRDCPDCSYAVNGLTLFVHQRSVKIELLERAIELDDENPYALANLGGELFGVDDYRALQLLEKALQINPRLFYARLCKSKVLLRLGNLPAAVEAARSQLEWQPRDEMAVRFLSQLEFRLDVVRRRMLLV